MKNLFLLLAFGLCAFAADAQLRVVTSGDVEADQDVKISGLLNVADDVSTGPAQFNVGQNRTGNGPAGCNFYHSDSGTPTFVLDVAVNGKSRIRQIGNQVMEFATLPNRHMLFQTYRNNDAAQYLMELRSDQKVNINGDLTVTGVFTNSDRRLKKDILEYQSGLDKLMQIRPVSFRYNGKGSLRASSRDHIGVVAQELQEVLPELVSDHIHNVYDVDGNVTEETYLKVNTPELTYVLVNAIQEQQEIIEEQKASIESLMDRLDEIEERINGLNDTGNEMHQIDAELNYSDVAGLEQNRPNPFNGVTTISYTIPRLAKSASLEILDMNGKHMKSIEISHLGNGEVNLTANDIPSGTYSYALVIDGEIYSTKKMIFSK